MLCILMIQTDVLINVDFLYNINVYGISNPHRTFVQKLKIESQ